ncbi:MAG: AAA family ATPase [Anaerolineae bacterium]|nr:AAA family ATPase [Anaerolineae bacterium]
MFSSLEKSVISPILVGRTPTLQMLHLALNRAKSKSGQMVLISGEAGIGKSRLVAEVKTYAKEQTFLTLQGNCFQPDLIYPFAPLLDLLRPYFAIHSSQLNTLLSPAISGQLSRLFPEFFSSIDASPILETEHNKRHLFTALLYVFSLLTTYQPLLVIIEDLHWSDDTSLEFLLQLARWSTAQPALVLITYRSDEIHPSLSRWLAQVDREHLTQEFMLHPLIRSEVNDLLKAIFELQRPIRADFLDAIQVLTEGNPFFIEEILKSLMVAGDIFYSDDAWDRKTLHELHIPRSVQAAVQQRVELLSITANQIIMVAAVTGRRFDFTLLQSLTDYNASELLSAIKELVGAQLVIEESAERFAFRHALTREAIYTNLLIRERVILHERIAEVLEHSSTLVPDSRVAELAYHFYEAEQWERAFQYSWRAGDLARQLYAIREAIEQFTRALDAVKHLEKPAPLALLRARGLTYEAQGDFEAARLDHEAILQTNQPNSEVKWRTLLDLGMLWASRDYVQTGIYYQQALALAREIEDSALVASSLNRLGNWHMNAAQPVQGQAYHQEALTLFQALDDPAGLAETLDLLGLAHYGICDLIQGAAYLQRSAALFRELGDQASLASSLTILMLCRHENYDTATMIPAETDSVETTHEGQLALQIAREIGWRSQEAFTGIQIGMCLALQGDYGRALQMAQAGLHLAEDIQHQQWLTSGHRVLGGLYFDLFALPLAQQSLEQASALAHEIGSSLWMSLTSAALASLAVRQGNFTQARTLIEALLKTYPIDQELFASRIARSVQAELALATDNADLALQIIDQLVVSAPNSTDQSRIPYLLKLRGEALIELGQWAAAQTALEAAQVEATRRGLRPLLWRIQVALGKLYQTQKLREEAEAACLTAQQIIESLAASISNDSLKTGFLQGATALIPAVPALSPHQITQKQFDGLTPREREIAVQIIYGKSNRSIAEQLFISDRTVESHISSIFSKLGFTSRAQIAVWAVEKGLHVKDTD